MSANASDIVSTDFAEIQPCSVCLGETALNYHDTMITSGNFCFAARRLFVLLLVSKLIWSFCAD